MAFLRLAQLAAWCCCLAPLHAGSGGTKVPPGHGEASEELGDDDAARFFQPAQLHAGLAVAAAPSFRGPGNRDRRANRELPILLWWSGGLFPHFPGETTRIDCPRGSCLATKDRRVRAHRRTRSLLFYGTDFRAYEAPLPRLPHQTWALFHEESPMNNYLLSHGAGIRLFNHTATFRRQSDFPLSLQWLPDLAYLRRPPPRGLPEKDRLRRQGLAPLLYLQSHCDVPADRDRYMRELMKHIQVRGLRPGAALGSDGHLGKGKPGVGDPPGAEIGSAKVAMVGKRAGGSIHKRRRLASLWGRRGAAAGI